MGTESHIAGLKWIPSIRVGANRLAELTAKQKAARGDQGKGLASAQLSSEALQRQRLQQ